MKDNKLVVGITQGDSNGIGYEVIIKALSDPRILDMLTPVVYGSSKIFSFYRKSIPEIEQMDTNAISSAAEAHARRVNIVGCLPDNVYAEPGGATAESAKAAITALEWAVRDLKAGKIDVLVTGPINKKAIQSVHFLCQARADLVQRPESGRERSGLFFHCRNCFCVLCCFCHCLFLPMQYCFGSHIIRLDG